MTTHRHFGVSVLVALGCCAFPAISAASDGPSIVGYGFDGFWSGAQIGLATGYLATGQDYESHEWRTLVFGAGVGALVGVGAGITLGIIDAGQPPPRTGWLVLRDMGYGLGLGAVVGVAVGALFVIDSGDPKDLAVGAAIGTLAGAGVGMTFGIIESASAEGKAARGSDIGGLQDLRLTVVGREGSWMPVPALVGSF